MRNLINLSGVEASNAPPDSQLAQQAQEATPLQPQANAPRDEESELQRKSEKERILREENQRLASEATQVKGGDAKPQGSSGLIAEES